MGYISGTTTEIYFAGLKVGEAMGFSKDPTVKWSENDFVGNPVTQYIPIKVDATGTIEKFEPDWQMFALALGYTYYNETAEAGEFFKNAENNPDVLWRYLEVFDLPYAAVGTADYDLDDGPSFPYTLGEFTARCPLANYLKIKAEDSGITVDGDVVIEIADIDTLTQAVTFTLDTTLLAGSLGWIELSPTQGADFVIGDEYRIRIISAGTDATGSLVTAKSFKYNASPNIRSAFVLGLQQNANDEGFEIRVYNRKENGDLAYIEDFTGVKFLRDSFEITPNELTKVSIDWYAAEYRIYKP